MKDCKPFVKWAGGKKRLIVDIKSSLPPDYGTKKFTYIEPFVGGGAVLFWMLQNYPNITNAVINDINPVLTNAYTVIKEEPYQLIEFLSQIENKYHLLKNEEERKYFFLEQREIFNTNHALNIEKAGLFIFLNRTCFNGLYRVNKSGVFNVPFGKYSHPKICDSKTILADSDVLQKVDILTGDFAETIHYVESKDTFFYFDPPYKPISQTSNFTTYTKEDFNDSDQIRLANFAKKINDLDCKFILSNSDTKNNDPSNDFFDNLYNNFSIIRVSASRMINAQPGGRGKISEILVSNIHLSNNKNMNPEFNIFMSQLTETNSTLESLTDFNKVSNNINKISLKLHQLNHVLGREDLFEAVKEVYEENSKAFSILGILVAIRDNKSILNNKNIPININSYFTNYEGICTFIKETGLEEVFKSKKITNLVDYVFGVEVGLDTNARKNRGGTIMEDCIAKAFDTAGIKYKTQVDSSNFKDIESLGEDLKRFDFVVSTPEKTYLIEANYYNGRGSKLNETARSYAEVATKINKYEKYEFVWITDGAGWHSAKNKLEEAFNIIPSIYNLTTLNDFIKKLQ